MILHSPTQQEMKPSTFTVVETSTPCCRIRSGVENEHGPGGPRAARPGPTQPAGRAASGRGLPRAVPGRCLAAGTENFCNNKQIVDQ